MSVDVSHERAADERAAGSAEPRHRTGTVRLLGRDIGYSASPAMQQAAFHALGLSLVYELTDVETGEVAGQLERLRRGDGIGANVTTPHKRTVATLVDELVGDAQRLGAVNTVVVAGSRLIGHNTDQPAIADELVTLVDHAPVHAVVLGSGGASGAVVDALHGVGAGRVTHVTRHGDGPAFADLPDVLRDADLVVNATPIGTNEDVSPVPAALLRPDLAVFDLIYRPSPTRLVRDARSVGARARGGAGMLVGQGYRSLELWLGVPAPVDVMRDALRRELGDPDV
jgi:shikimate dehydrogenase